MKKAAFFSILLSTLVISQAWCANDNGISKDRRSNLENPFETTQGAVLEPAPAANNVQPPSGNNEAVDKKDDQTLTDKEKKIVEETMDKYDCESFKVDSVSSSNVSETPQKYRLVTEARTLMTSPPQLVIITNRVYDVNVEEYLPSQKVREVRVSLFYSADSKNSSAGKGNITDSSETKSTTDPFEKYRKAKKDEYSRNSEEIKLMASKFDMSSLDEMKKIAWETFSTGRETRNEELLKKAMDMFQKLVYSTNGSGKYLCYLGRCHAELFFAGKTNGRAENELTELKNNAIELYGRARAQLEKEPDESGSVSAKDINYLLSEIKNAGEMKYFKQPTPNSCQLTCVAMVLSKYGWNGVPQNILDRENGEKLREEAKAKPVNPDYGLERVFNMLAAESNLKVRLRGYVGAVEPMRYLLAQGKPVIVHTYTTDGHVIVLTGFDGTHYTAFDPYDKWNEVRGSYNHSESGEGARYSRDPMDKALDADINDVWYYDVYPDGFPNGVRPAGDVPEGYSERK